MYRDMIKGTLGEKEKRKALKRRASQLKVAQKSVKKKDGASGSEDSSDSVKMALPRGRGKTAKLGQRKTSGIFKGTQDREFHVEDGKFAILGKDGKVKHIYDLSQVQAVANDLKNDVKKGRFAFDVKTPQKKMTLYADSEEEREEWIRQMRPMQEGEGVPSPFHSKLEGNFKHLTSGRTYVYTLTGFDKYEQRCVEGGVTVQGRVKLPDGSLKECVVKDNRDGTYILTFKATIMGKAQFDVLIDGEPLKDCPYVLDVAGGMPSAADSYAKLDDTLLSPALNSVDPNSGSLSFRTIKVGRVDVATQILVHICDSFGNHVKPKSTLEVSFTRDGVVADDVFVEITPVSEGLYRLEYLSPLAGNVLLSISLGGKAIRESPFQIYIKPGLPSEENTLLTGDNLGTAELYKETVIHVELKDEEGNPCDSSASLVAYFTDQNNVKVESFEVSVSPASQPGMFDVVFVPSLPGQFYLNLIGHGKPYSVPFPVSVPLAPPCPPQCLAKGSGLSGSPVDIYGSFTLVLLDERGHTSSNANNLPISVTFINAETDLVVDGNVSISEPDASDNGHANGSNAGQNNVKLVKYRISEGGNYRMSVKVAGEHIQMSPFAVTIGGGTLLFSSRFKLFRFMFSHILTRTEPSSSELSSYTFGEPELVVGTTYAIDVLVKDVNGTPYDGPAAVSFELEPLDSKLAVSSVAMSKLAKVVVVREDGRMDAVKITFVPIRAGKFNLSANLNGVAIGGKKMPVTILPASTSPMRSLLEGNLHECQTYVETALTIGFVDIQGNPTPSVRPSISILDSDKVDCSTDFDLVLARDEGEEKAHVYHITFAPDREGAFQLCLAMLDEHGRSRPFLDYPVRVDPAPADPERCQAWGKGLERPIVNKPCSFDIAVSDRKGFVVTGPQEVQLAFEGDENNTLSFDTTLVDNEDGTYSVTYIPTVLGSVSIKVRINGENINGSPFTVYVDKGCRGRLMMEARLTDIRLHFKH